MRKLTFLAVTLAAVLFPAAGSAQVTLGARLGYSIAGGEAVKDGDMNDVVSGSIPVQLEAGFKLTPELQVGAYASYGFVRWGGETADGCDVSGVDCSGSIIRLGVQGQFAFEDLSPQLVPWIGAGFGWERAKARVEGGGFHDEEVYKGWELINLQGGADMKLAPSLKVGLFASLSFNRFGSFEQDYELPPPFGAGSDSGDIEDKGTHTYLTFGVRGEFGM